MDFALLYIGYFVVVGVFLAVNAVICGYKGVDFNLSDVLGSLIWPLTVLQLIGTLIRIYKEKEQNGKK